MNLKHRVLHTFPSALRLLPFDALRYEGELLCGVQHGLFEQDEAAWDGDKNGQWRGPVPIRTVPRELALVGATEEVDTVYGLGPAGESSDTLHRLDSGAELRVRFGIHEPKMVKGSGVYQYILQDLSSGDAILSGLFEGVEESGVSGSSIGTAPDGSYLLLVRLYEAARPFALPDDYTRNDAAYLWGEELEEYWDYVYNVGKKPPPGHEFYNLRAALEASNSQLDKPEWADFLIDDSPANGEWSARKVCVGAGAFAIAPGVLPLTGTNDGPGPALYILTSPTERTPVTFDIMARTVSVLKVNEAGDLLLAGLRMCPTGNLMALWRFDGAEYVLLGTDANPSNGWCECALANHGPTEVLEARDGTVWVLSKCSLHKYRPLGATLEDRLPGVPEISEGRPGGHSLRESGGRLYWTTENFDQTNWTDEQGRTRAQFYDYLVVQQGMTRGKGPGTRFHGSNDLSTWLGRLWGVMQDLPDNDPAARQYITWYDNGDWSFATSLRFPAASMQWQRLTHFESGQRNVLLVFGKEAKTSQGIIGRGDGQEFVWSTFPYRVRRLTLSDPEAGLNDGHKVVITPGRPASAAGFTTADWSLIETTGQWDSVIFCNCGGPNSGYCTSYDNLTELELTADDLPPFLQWTATPQGPGPGYWVGVETVTPGAYYLVRVDHPGDGEACYELPDGGTWPPGVDPEDYCRLVWDPSGNKWVPTNEGCPPPHPPEPPFDVAVVTLFVDPSDPERVHAIQAIDVGVDRLLEEYNKTVAGVWCRVDSTADIDDLTTYTERVPYSMWYGLRTPAKERVDVLFYVPTGTLWEELDLKVVRRQ